MSKCTLSGLCGVSNTSNLRLAMEDPVLAPFIEVKIHGSNDAIVAQALSAFGFTTPDVPTFGVGNKSFPAIVKSLKVGASNGFGVEIEIVDQEGGDFSKIYDKVARGGTATDYNISVRWGWISTACNGGNMPKFCGAGSGDPTQDPQPGSCSPEIRIPLLSMQVNYSQGLIKYTLTGIDMVDTLHDSTSGAVMGTSEEPMYLLDALTQLFKGRAVNIKFIKLADAKSQGDFNFDTTGGGSVDPKKGPKAVWPALHRPVLETAYEWVRPLVEASGLGLKVFYDPLGDPATLTFVAYTGPICSSSVVDLFNVGTYVVNGGNCSSVIEFKPEIKYVGAVLYSSGGTGGGASSPGTTPDQGPAPCLDIQNQLPNIINTNPLKAGNPLAISLNRWEVTSRMNGAMKKSFQSTALNAMANYHQPIQANLKIQGNPNYSSPVLFINRYITLIVINPYQVEDGCKWSNIVQCNNVLSSSNWRIAGVSHEIKEGSYTTTLKIELIPGPGQTGPLVAPPGV